MKDRIIDCILKGDFELEEGIMLQTQMVIGEIPDYKKLRQLHNMNVDKCVCELGVTNKFIELSKRDNKRIVIFTEQLLNENHAPTKIVLNYGAALRKIGYDVMIFVCPSSQVLPLDLWYRPRVFNSNDVLVGGVKCLNYNGEEINIFQVLLGEREVYKKIVDWVYEYNPLFVFNMGISNVIGDVMRNFTTVVEMGMTTNCPVSEADILLKFTKDYEEDKIYENELEKYQKTLLVEEKMPVLFKKTGNEYCRESVGLPSDKFLVAIVGNRLDIEVDDKFIQVMKRILEKNDKVDFVIIGTVEKLKETFEDDIKTRVHYLGYVDDL